MTQVDQTTIVVAEQDVVGCALGSGSTLLNLNSNIYYRLNEVGTFVWNEISQPVPFSELCRRTAEEFAASPDQVTNDLADLLTSLAAAGLVRHRVQ